MQSIEAEAAGSAWADEQAAPETQPREAWR